jgi:hypothetical protein
MPDYCKYILLFLKDRLISEQELAFDLMPDYAEEHGMLLLLVFNIFYVYVWRFDHVFLASL